MKISRDAIRVTYKKMDNQFFINRDGRAFEGEPITFERFMRNGEPLDEFTLEELESQAVDGWIEIIEIERLGGAYHG